MRTERGQATIDYIALIAVMAILLGAGVGLVTGGAPGVANAVLGQVRHALCIVTGSSCRAERRLPCVVASDRDGRHVAVTISSSASTAIASSCARSCLMARCG
jgi:hypothetical protein